MLVKPSLQRSAAPLASDQRRSGDRPSHLIWPIEVYFESFRPFSIDYAFLLRAAIHRTSVRTNKAQALLIYLAVEAETAQRRDNLMLLLWPDLPLKSAQINLRQTLHRLRQAIPAVATEAGAAAVPLLLADRQMVSLNPDGLIETDVEAFAKLISRPDNITALEQAAALYRGDFLSDFYLSDSGEFEAWAGLKRAEFRRQALEVLAWNLAPLSCAALRLGDLAAARQHLHQSLCISVPIGAFIPTLFSLPMTALVLAEQNQVELALELWTFSAQHPFVGRSAMLDQLVGQPVTDAAAATLSPRQAAAAQSRGRARAHWPTVKELLRTLTEWGWGKGTGYPTSTEGQN